MTYIGKFKSHGDAEAALLRFALMFTKMNINDEDLVEYFGIENGLAQAHAEIESILDQAINTIDRTISARKQLERMVAEIEQNLRRQDNARWN